MQRGRLVRNREGSGAKTGDRVLLLRRQTRDRRAYCNVGHGACSTIVSGWITNLKQMQTNAPRSMSHNLFFNRSLTLANIYAMHSPASYHYAMELEVAS